jgi:urea transport system permease protein
MSVLAMARRLRLLVLLLGLLTPTAAFADLESDVQGLREDSNDAKGKAVELLVAGGDERAVPILEAFLDGRLFLTDDEERMVIGADSSGGYQIYDAMSGEDRGEVGKRDVSKIRVNNRLRRAISGALGGLTLMSPSRGTRMAAAEAVFKSRDPANLEAIDKALAEHTESFAWLSISRLQADDGALDKLRARGYEIIAPE